MNDIYQKSNQIFNDNIRWLLYSGIRIRHGQDRGAFYGWKNIDSSSYPFIYNEITGYAITTLSWIHSELRHPGAIKAAIGSAKWIVKNMDRYLLVAGLPVIDDFHQKANLSDLIYSFDNGIIMIGLLNLYKTILDKEFLILAEQMAKSLIELFFDGSKLIAVVDILHNNNNNNNNNLTLSNNSGDDSSTTKWSTISGAYHCKLSLGLLELSRLTNKRTYSEVSDTLCDFAIRLQKPDGRFITNPNSDFSYLHPHLYACEGLIYAGIRQSNEDYYTSGLKGIVWAIHQLNPSTGGLPRNSVTNSIEQSDCMAQLLRLLILCRVRLEREKLKGYYMLTNVIDRLHLRLMNFYIPAGEDKGAMKYQLALESACSWCTMFSVQALRLWLERKKLENARWISYYI
jgi:hypothetical protein